MTNRKMGRTKFFQMFHCLIYLHESVHMDITSRHYIWREMVESALQRGHQYKGKVLSLLDCLLHGGNKTAVYIHFIVFCVPPTTGAPQSCPRV